MDSEVNVTDGIARRVYKVARVTTDLGVMIDDWSLICSYDLALDGTCFYAKESALNRYEPDGTIIDSATFGGTGRGGAWDRTYRWTLNDINEMKC